MAYHVFGIRHHGPGSARSLRDALARLQPDLLLIEGPPEADGLLPLAAHAEMKPPVALLVYNPETPAQAVYYPFAAFSPEWQAIHHGLKTGVPVRFMDLPVGHRMALDAEREPVAGETENAEETDAVPLQRDPLHYIALAAGYNDSERWWEH